MRCAMFVGTLWVINSMVGSKAIVRTKVSQSDSLCASLKANGTISDVRLMRITVCSQRQQNHKEGMVGGSPEIIVCSH